MHYPAEELDTYILKTVAKKWLFAGASIYDVKLLHEDYDKHLLGLHLQCTWQEKIYPNMKVATCTASSALAQAVLVHTAGHTCFLDLFKAVGILDLPDVTAAAETGTAHDVYYDMTADRNKFMAYCMVMRIGGFFSSDKLAFDWSSQKDEADNIGQWALDKLSSVLCYHLANKDEFWDITDLRSRVLVYLDKSEASAKTVQIAQTLQKSKVKIIDQCP